MRATLAKNSWVTCPKPNSKANLRLFCFPYAGGGASIFRTWSDYLPSDVQVCPIQLPGRQSRMFEPPFTQLMPLVQTLAEALHPYLDIPFALFGHSMGALISFEFVRQLRRQNGINPVCLFVSSCRAPQKPDPYPPIHALPESTFIEALRQFNGIPEEILRNAELMQLMLPTLQADFMLCETYVYSTQNPLDCPISVFGGMHDYRVSYDGLVSWRYQTRSFFRLRMFPGSHFFLNSAQLFLLRAISQDLKWFLSHMIQRGQRF